MQYDRIFGWLKLDMAVFVAANAFLLVRYHDRLASMPLGWFEVVVLGFAVYRMANVLSSEPVTKPLRAPFVKEEQHGSKVVERPKETGFRGAFGLLIYCPSCTGVWIAATVVYLYAFWPGPTFVVALIFALSGIERVLTVLVGKLKRRG
jgi:hypothetical protein